jgi:hypothetical protein
MLPSSHSEWDKRSYIIFILVFHINLQVLINWWFNNCSVHNVFSLMVNNSTAVTCYSSLKIFCMMLDVFFYKGSDIIIAVIIAISHVKNHRYFRFLTSVHKFLRKEICFQTWVSLSLLLKQTKHKSFHNFTGITLYNTLPHLLQMYHMKFYKRKV